MENFYDVIIIGGGPAGMTAGIYAQRAGMKCVMIEKAAVGGQVAITQSIANYPGFSEIDGFELSQKMFEQATNLGMETIYGEVTNITLKDEIKSVTVNNQTINSYAIILCMGATSKGLGVENEFKYIGKGVSYCAVCDGNFFKNKTVAVVGGGNTALGDIIYLSNICQKIVHIHRRKVFRAQDVEIQNYENIIKNHPEKIEQKLGYTVEKLLGEGKITGVQIKNTESGELENINVDAVFVAVGRVPQTDFLDGQIELLDNYIKTNNKMETNVKGVFAGGDIVYKNLRQIATAISDGAIAGTSASEYVKNIKKQHN